MTSKLLFSRKSYTRGKLLAMILLLCPKTVEGGKNREEILGVRTRWIVTHPLPDDSTFKIFLNRHVHEPMEGLVGQRSVQWYGNAVVCQGWSVWRPVSETVDPTTWEGWNSVETCPASVRGSVESNRDRRSCLAPRGSDYDASQRINTENQTSKIFCCKMTTLYTCHVKFVRDRISSTDINWYLLLNKSQWSQK